MKEAIFSFRNGGQYFQDPNGVYQSIGVIKLIGLLLESPTLFFLFQLVLEVAQLGIKVAIVDRVWSSKRNVTSFEINVVMMVVFLDPLQAFNLTSHNVPPIKDLLTLICIYSYLWAPEVPLVGGAAAIGLCLYVEPASWPMHLGFLLSSTNPKQRLSSIFGVALFSSLLALGGSVRMQLHNIWNILTIKDHSENIGLFYYISIETFRDHLNFFLYAYLIYQVIMQTCLSMLAHRLRHVTTLAT